MDRVDLQSTTISRVNDNSNPSDEERNQMTECILSRFQLQTKSETDIINITDKVRKIVQSEKITDGLATVMTLHVTTGLMVSIDEQNLLTDIENMMLEIAPSQRDYLHHKWLDIRTGEYASDAWAHLRSIFLLDPSVSVPVSNGDLVLGPNQNIFFVELRGPQQRGLALHIIGRRVFSSD